MKKLKTEQNQVAFLTGPTPEIKPEKSVSIEGALTAPREFLENKTGSESASCFVERPTITGTDVKLELQTMYDYKQSYLKVRNENKCIDLLLNTKNNVTDQVIGTLTRHKVWDQLKVNTDSGWHVAELRKLIKRLKFYFDDPEQHSDFLLKLHDFSAKVETTIKDKNVSGSFENSRAVALINNESQEFKINAPIYKGYENKVVRVEVLADVSDGSVRYVLESQDLFLLEEELWSEYLMKELKFFHDNDISVVTIN